MSDSKSVGGGGDGASPSKMDSGTSGSSAKSDMKDDAGTATEKSQADNRGDRGPDRSKANEKQAKDKAATPDRDAANGSARADEGKARSKDDSARSGEKGDDKSAATGKSEGASGAGAGPKLSGDQRTKVQTGFRAHKEKSVKDLNISINIGTSVPRSVTLYAVPEDVVVVVPEYRRYKYFVYEDEVVIVDPDTYEIVEVIVLT